MTVKRIGILYHPMIESANILAKELKNMLTKLSVSSWLCSAWEKDSIQAQVNDTDLLLSIGGDGTILRAAQAVIPGKSPTPSLLRSASSIRSN